MLKYSDATSLVWKIAAIEAQNLKHQEIEPVDLMLALLKAVDIEIEKLADTKSVEAMADLNSGVGELKCIFVESGVMPVKTRRRLRREAVHHQKTDYKGGVIHRSTRSKDVFKRAENFLSTNEKMIRPIHLLAALLDKAESDLDRVLLLVNFPASLLKALLCNKLASNSDRLIYPTLPSIPMQPTGSEDLLRHCRAAIGYLELSMKDEAKSELQKIPLSEQGHPMVRHLLSEVEEKLP